MIPCLWQATGDFICLEEYENANGYNINVIIKTQDEQGIIYKNSFKITGEKTSIMTYRPTTLEEQKRGCIIEIQDMTMYIGYGKPSLRLLIKNDKLGITSITFNNNITGGNIGMRTGKVRLEEIGKSGIEILFQSH